MASKTSKKAMAAVKGNGPAVKDDGTRFIVRDLATKAAVYGERGVARADAERLATGLVAPAYIEQVA